MVSFTSITQCVTLISIMMIGSSIAAPAGDKVSSSAALVADVATVPHITFNSTAEEYKFPPIITSRASRGTDPIFRGDLDAETKSIEANKKWFVEHGGNLTSIDKRDAATVAGLTMALPANAPPAPKLMASGIINASSAQITDFRLHAAIALTAYCDTVVPAGKWTCANCKKYVPDGKLILTFTSAEKEIGGFLLRSDTKKTIFLVFRGSSNLQNWITNLEFFKTDYTPVAGAEVHKGFYKAYKEVATYFYSRLLSQHKAYPGYKVVVTGHSLGGAQALLGAMDLYQRVATLNRRNLKLYTSGAPRVGNDEFAYYVDYTGVPNSRSVNDRDIVAHLPPQAFGFLHPGVEAWARTASSAQICTSNIETDSCSNSIVPFTSASDHAVYYGVNHGDCS